MATASATKIGSSAVNASILRPATSRNDGAVAISEYRTRFPVGVVVETGVAGHLKSSWRTIAREVMAAGMYDILGINIQPKRENTETEGPAVAIEEVSPDGRMKYVPYVNGSLGDGGLDQSLNNDWYTLESGSQTSGLADTFADRICDVYDLRPSVLAYMVGDDVVNSSGTASVHTGPEVNTIATAMHARDPYGRPSFGTYRDSHTAYSQVDDANLKIIMYSIYPVNVGEDGYPQEEGDFHGYSATYDLLGSPGDFIDVVRYLRSESPADAIWWWHGQTHQTKRTDNPDGPWPESTKIYPTANEMQLMFWQLIGEGIKGIYWFTWTSRLDEGDPVQWYGLSHSSRTAELAMATRLARRLTPNIRARLMAADRDAMDRFSVSGGGSSGYAVDYANAYVSTLYDADSDVYYVVIANHSASTASITVSGTGAPWTTGVLTNLETGAATDVGNTVSLGAFDGSIWRWSPSA